MRPRRMVGMVEGESSERQESMSSADYDVAYCDACERCHLNGICPLTDKAQMRLPMTDAGWAGCQVTQRGRGGKG